MVKLLLSTRSSRTLYEKNEKTLLRSSPMLRDKYSSRTYLFMHIVFERIPDPDAAKLRARLDLLAVCPHILSKKAIV